MLYLDSRTRSASSQTEENIEEGSSPEPDETHGAPIYGLGDSIPRIKFSQEAQPIFNAWLASIEDELFIMKEESEAFEAHLSKFRKLVPTLALIFEGIKTADSRKDILEVSKESLDLAISWAAFLREHAVRVYAISNNPSLRGAHALLTKIKAGQIKDGTSLRKIYRHHWMHLKDRDAVDAAASFLEDINMVKIDTVKVDQTTTDILRINPQVYQS